MGHSDIGVTLNTYTHLGLEDAQDELGRIAEIENARREMDKLGGEKTQEMFRVMGYNSYGRTEMYAHLP